MMYLCLMLFTGLLLAVVGISIDYGKPTMISEIYYTAKERGWSLPCWSVPVLLVVMGGMCLPVMLNIGGFEFAAFLTCAGLMFVGAAPAYLDGDDHVYVANMCKADFWGKSIKDEESLAHYIKDTVDDVDQKDGFIFNRFYADCCHNGMPIPWEDLL